MGWAAGAAKPGTFTNFREACAKKPDPDFDKAADECHMDDRRNPGLVPRNAANYHLFKNAARAIDNKEVKSKLWYPVWLLKELVITGGADD
jgi:hypothetical protein